MDRAGRQVRDGWEVTLMRARAPLAVLLLPVPERVEFLLLLLLLLRKRKRGTLLTINELAML